MLVFARNPLKVNIAGRTTVGQRFEVPESSNTVELLELNQLNDWLADKAIDTYASADVRARAPPARPPARPPTTTTIATTASRRTCWPSGSCSAW